MQSSFFLVCTFIIFLSCLTSLLPSCVLSGKCIIIIITRRINFLQDAHLQLHCWPRLWLGGHSVSYPCSPAHVSWSSWRQRAMCCCILNFLHFFCCDTSRSQRMQSSWFPRKHYFFNSRKLRGITCTVLWSSLM